MGVLQYRISTFTKFNKIYIILNIHKIEINIPRQKERKIKFLAPPLPITYDGQHLCPNMANSVTVVMVGRPTRSSSKDTQIDYLHINICCN